MRPVPTFTHVQRITALMAILALAFPAASQTETPVIHVNSQIVIEEVSVSDAHGNPVQGLKQDQFQIFEDGKPQTIKNFEEHKTLSPTEAAKFPPMPKLDPDVFTNYTPAPENEAVNVVLLDSLNTPLESQAYEKQQLLQFLKTLKPGTRLAIFAMNRELHLLQGFTSDPEVLKAALSGKKGMSHTSTLMNDAVGGDYGPDSTESDAYGGAAGNDPNFVETLANIQQIEAEEQSFELEMRALYTLDAMNQLARYLSGIPGRKNLIWFSGSFPIDLLPNGDMPDPFSVMGDSEDEFRETVTLFARSHVAVYPVDTRGLQVNPLMTAENSGTKYSDNTRGKKDQDQFFSQSSDEHDTMTQLADKTGGKAFFNTNGLKDAVEHSIDAGSNFYSLSYDPRSHNWDGKYHTISVKLSDPKLKLTYRIGYYADDPDGPPNKNNAPLFKSTITAVANPKTTARISAMQAAMQFGAPEPTQIVMKLRVLPIGDKPEDKPVEGNVVDPKLAQGPYQRYGIDYAADARHVQFVPQPDGSYSVTLEFAVLIYDDQGKLYNSLTKTAVAQVDAARRASILKSGMHFHQEISVPVKGSYYLRAGIHDRVSDAMGAVELDLNNVKKIAAAPAPVAH